jgi:hypothetical protein
VIVRFDAGVGVPSLTKAPANMKQPMRSDIVEADGGIMLGEGWSALASADEQPYRTVGARATFAVADGARSSHIIMMSVEPDDYNTIPILKISCRAGVLADVPIHGRQIVRAMVPQSVVPETVTIATSGAGDTVPAVRVMSVMAHRSFGEIILESEFLRLGANWYPLEIFGGRAFRWAPNDVSLYVDAGFNATELVLDLETGPAAADGVRLELRDESGAVIASGAAASGLQRVRFDVSAVRAPAKLTLAAEGGGSESTSEDDRVLNYRVFDISAVQR